MSPGTRPIYGIGAVARMLDVASATIRNWEDRYGVVRPQRSSGGQRLYSRDDLEQLRFIRDEVERGATPSDAHRLLEERMAVTGGGPTMEPPADAPELLILLAERDPYAGDLAEYLLRTEGFAVEVVATPDDAVEAFAAKAPALVIVELLLGGGQGVELCRELKRRGAGAVIATSALQLGDEALAADADAFLAKPFDSLLLISTVKDLLTRSALLGSANAVAT
jgi:DNA-binding transcriptional MerR regulator